MHETSANCLIGEYGFPREVKERRETASLTDMAALAVFNGGRKEKEEIPPTWETFKRISHLDFDGDSFTICDNGDNECNDKWLFKLVGGRFTWPTEQFFQLAIHLYLDCCGTPVIVKASLYVDPAELTPAGETLVNVMMVLDVPVNAFVASMAAFKCFVFALVGPPIGGKLHVNFTCRGYNENLNLLETVFDMYQRRQFFSYARGDEAVNIYLQHCGLDERNEAHLKFFLLKSDKVFDTTVYSVKVKWSDKLDFQVKCPMIGTSALTDICSISFSPATYRSRLGTLYVYKNLMHVVEEMAELGLLEIRELMIEHRPGNNYYFKNMEANVYATLIFAETGTSIGSTSYLYVGEMVGRSSVLMKTGLLLAASVPFQMVSEGRQKVSELLLDCSRKLVSVMFESKAKTALQMYRDIRKILHESSKSLCCKDKLSPYRLVHGVEVLEASPMYFIQPLAGCNYVILALLKRIETLKFFEVTPGTRAAALNGLFEAGNSGWWPDMELCSGLDKLHTAYDFWRKVMETQLSFRFSVGDEDRAKRVSGKMVGLDGVDSRIVEVYESFFGWELPVDWEGACEKFRSRHGGSYLIV